jgi:NCS1 family nucleobase:cation symporter-1
VIGMAASLLQDYLMASFFDWVLLVGAFMIPVFAILLVDYYVLKNRGDAPVKTFNVRALISYVVAVVFSLYFTYWQPLDTGVTAFTFLLAGMLYLSLSLKLRANVQPLAKEL